MHVMCTRLKKKTETLYNNRSMYQSEDVMSLAGERDLPNSTLFINLGAFYKRIVKLRK